MARTISLSSVFAFIFINCHLWRSIDSQLYAHLGDSFLEQEVTYDELYQSGMQSYTNEDWASTIFFFERALQEFDYYRASLTECRLKCQNVSHISSTGVDALSELKVFEGVFKKADCTRRCKLKKLGGRSDRIDDAVTDKFLSMTPYSYLQFAYYKSGLYEQAVSAAYTYLQWHSDDDVMQNNLDYYRNMHGIDDSQLVNWEEKPHHKYFLEGYQDHHDEKWEDVITNMELALTNYWKADTQCRALCEGKYDNREFMDLYEAIAYHYASTLYCKSQCENWLSRINNKLVDDFLPSHFHFLQFAYYKVNDVQNAIKNALSYLLLLPKDEVMLQNVAFYESMKDPSLEFMPRPDVRDYHRLITMETKLLEFAKKNFWEEDAEEYLHPDKDIEDQEGGTDYLGAEPIDPKEVNLKTNQKDEMKDETKDGEEGDGEGKDEEEEERLRKVKEVIAHGIETNSAKYTRDLNGGVLPPGAEFPQSESGSGGGLSGDMRSKIMSGMKKIMKSLMGLSEEESEQLLVQLAKDPTSSGARAKIKVAIEKMMSSSDKDKALTREQLRTMMQGLSKGPWMEEMQRQERDNGKKENFDPDAVGKAGKELVFPSNHQSMMLDDKDYDPMEGLDRKEYFDWVNPPGFEAGAPGSPEDDVEDVDQPGYHGNSDEDDDANAADDEKVMIDVEYYPSDEDGIDKQNEVKVTENDAVVDNEEEVKDDFCLPGAECQDAPNHQTKYAKETHPNIHTDAELDQDIDDDPYSNHDDEMDLHDDDDFVGNEGDEETENDNNINGGHHGNRNMQDDDRNMKENNGNAEDRDEDSQSIGNHGNRQTRGIEDDDGQMERDGDEDDWEGDWDEEWDEDGEDYGEEGECEWDGDTQKCREEELEDLPFIQRKLTPKERMIQELLDEEVPEETRTWMDEMMKIDDNAYFLLDDLPELETLMTDDQLNGSNRVMADGLAAEQECGTLLRLLDGEGKSGDGYKGKTSPHTKFENFEGLTVKNAVDAAAAGRIPLLYPTVYMHLAERSRQYLQRHFRLKSHLFFSFTHLVCRSAGPGILTAYSSLKRDDLSHPVHADNCQLDHKGNCHKRLPAFVWRDWSAILYLNQEFEGGEFIFAHFNNSAQAVVTPKCGRLVGFSAGSENLHGVKGVIHGRRCALAMWYTLDPRFRELEFFQAADHLNTLYEAEYKRQQH